MEGEIQWVILTHQDPDYDAALAAWLLKKCGGEKYQGIEKAQIAIFDPKAPLTPYMIPVDCGGGMYDHHPHDKCPDDCAATLVAKDLSIFDDPCLEELLREVKRSDLKGGDAPGEFGRGIKAMNGCWKFPEVIDWAFKYFEARYNSQLNFMTSGLGQKIIEVNLPGNIVRYIYWAVTGNEKFSAYARFKGAMVAVQKHPETGNVQIFTNKNMGRVDLIMDDIVRAIRVEESWAQKRGFPKIPDKARKNDYLASADKIPEVPEWYYHKVGEQLLNGSNSHKDVAPTRIPLEKIVEITRIAVSRDMPNPACVNAPCRNNGCKYFYYSMKRCCYKRYQEEKQLKEPAAPPADG